MPELNLKEEDLAYIMAALNLAAKEWPKFEDCIKARVLARKIRFLIGG